MAILISSKDELRTYNRFESVIFHRTRDEYGGLSNMASGYPIRVNGIKVSTSEALYQACRFPDDPEIQKIIIGQVSPMAAKELSRGHANHYTRSDWLLVRGSIMRWCLRAKLAQNFSKFSALLLSTGDRSIVEYSNKDNYWGAKPVSEFELVGQNVLGRLLMELRELIKVDSEGRLLSVSPLRIPNFNFLGAPICEVLAADRIVTAEDRQAALNL